MKEASTIIQRFRQPLLLALAGLLAGKSDLDGRACFERLRKDQQMRSTKKDKRSLRSQDGSGPQFLPSKLPALRQVASRFDLSRRGIDTKTQYDKRMTFLSNKLFIEPTRPVSVRSQVALRVLTEEPLEQREDLSVEYYPNQPMFHYLTKMLRLHGLYLDEHVVWRQIQDELQTMRGKVVHPKPGQGKRALMRGSQKK